MVAKSNAARVLDTAGITYELVSYDLDGVVFSAETVADALGVPREQVFKTLVVEGDRTEPCFAVVPAGARLDLTALGAASGNRRMRLASVEAVPKLTGYVRGAVTVLGARRPFATFVEETALLHDRIGVSGGAAGLEIVLDPRDFVDITGAEVVDIARWDD